MSSTAPPDDTAGEKLRAVTCPHALQIRTGRPGRDGPSVHGHSVEEGYFFFAFFVVLFVFFAGFLEAFGFAMDAPIAFATFRS